MHRLVALRTQVDDDRHSVDLPVAPRAARELPGALDERRVEVELDRSDRRPPCARRTVRRPSQSRAGHRVSAGASHSVTLGPATTTVNDPAAAVPHAGGKTARRGSLSLRIHWTAVPCGIRQSQSRRHGGGSRDGDARRFARRSPGLLHLLPSRARRKRRPRAGLGRGGAGEARREAQLLPLRPGTRLLPPLHARPREPVPLRRLHPGDPREGGPRRHGAPGSPVVLGGRRDAGPCGRRDPVHGGSCRQAGRPLQEPQRRQGRLPPGHGGARPGAAAPLARHAPRGPSHRRPSVPRRLV